MAAEGDRKLLPTRIWAKKPHLPEGNGLMSFFPYRPVADTLQPLSSDTDEKIQIWNFDVLEDEGVGGKYWVATPSVAQLL